MWCGDPPHSASVLWLMHDFWHTPRRKVGCALGPGLALRGLPLPLLLLLRGVNARLAASEAVGPRTV